jgi:hypothetical protein
MIPLSTYLFSPCSKLLRQTYLRVDFGNAEEHVGILAGGQVHTEKPVHNILVSFFFNY